MNREKQIEEMAEELRHSCEGECFKNKDGFVDCEVCKALLLYNAGYRKQSEGEWKVTNNDGFWHYDCPFCDDGYAQETKLPVSNYCANCGAKLSELKMKGE